MIFDFKALSIFSCVAVVGSSLASGFIKSTIRGNKQQLIKDAIIKVEQNIKEKDEMYKSISERQRLNNAIQSSQEKLMIKHLNYYY